MTPHAFAPPRGLFSLLLLAALSTTTPLLSQQQPTREYIRLGGRVIAIETVAPPVPPPAFIPNASSAGAEGLAGSFTLTVSQNWTLSSSPDLLVARKTGTCSASPTGGVNNDTGTVAQSSSIDFCYWAMPNPGPTNRSLTATVSTASNSAVSFVVSETALSVSSGATVSIGSGLSSGTITASGATGWSVSPGLNQGWFAYSLSGSTISWTAIANPNTAARSATLSVLSGSNSPQPGATLGTIQFSQAGSSGAGGCTTLTATPNGPAYPPSTVPGGQYDDFITVVAGGSWTASSNASWLTILAGSSGAGSSTGERLDFRAAVNTTGSSRDGTITFTGCGQTRTVTIRQMVPAVSISPSSYSLSPGQSAIFNALIGGTPPPAGSAVLWTPINLPTGVGGNWCAGSTSCGDLLTATYTAGVWSTAPSPSTVQVKVNNQDALSPATINYLGGTGPSWQLVSFGMQNQAGSTITSGSSGRLVVQTEGLTFFNVLISSATTGVPACYLSLNNTYLGLQVDNGSGFVAGGLDWYLQPGNVLQAQGGTGFLTNSQCRINLDTSRFETITTSSQNARRMTADVEFLPGFSGTKTMYFGTSAGWTDQGTFTIPNNNAIPTILSMNPASGTAVTGAPIAVSAVVSDPNGASDVDYVELKFTNTTGASANACYLRYTRSTSTFQLANDAGTLASINSNSQCNLNSTSASTDANGNITVTASITFASGFAGSRLYSVFVKDSVNAAVATNTPFELTVGPGFTMSTLNPSSILLTAGGTAVPVTVNITRIGGFTDAITVSASGLPANVSASPITIAAGATTGTLNLTAASTAAAVSNANVTVTGTGAGVVSQSQNLVTSVQVPSFSLSVSPASVSLNAGGSSVAVTATITRSGGFTGSVSLALTGLPAGVTPNSATIAAGSTSTVINLVAAAGSAAASNVTVTATGSGSGVTNQTKTFQVSVIPPSFTMSLTPSSISLVPGGASVGLQISITRLGTFTGAVSLTLSGLSSGVSPSTASIAAGATSTTINMVAASGAPQATNQTVTVTGSGSGVANQSGSFLLTVQPITVSVGPSGVSRQPGQTQQFTATATGNTAVTWSLTGIGALSSATANTVIYTAPLNITYTQYPQIKATSVADPTKSATVGVTLNPPNPPSVGFVGLGLYTASTATYTIQATANPGRIQEITYYASDMSYSTNKCQLRYDQAANRLYIGGWLYDWEGNPAGIGWTSSGIVGSAGTISGFSCSVDLAQSSAAITGDTLTLNLRISLPMGSTRMDIGATDYSGFNAWVSGGYTNVSP